MELMRYIEDRGEKMVGAILFFILLFGYYSLVKGEKDSLKIFLIIVCIGFVLFIAGSISNQDSSLDSDAITTYEMNHRNDWKGYKGTRRNSMAEDEKLKGDGYNPSEYRSQHGY